MNRRLIRSDRFVILSDDDPEPFRICLAQTPSPTCARFATDRTGAARHIGRDLQALRSTELPLRRRTGTRSEAVSVDQPARRATATRLRAQRRSSASCPTDRQFSPATRNARRDLRDQYGTPAATGGSGVDRHGPGPRRPRLRQGGRHHRRHDCVLSRRRCSAVRSGGAR
jgi:hypothetical protein